MSKKIQNKMKNKVIITIETDGVITVKSVECANQFPCDEIKKENEIASIMKSESAGNWLDEYIKYYEKEFEKIMGEQTKREYVSNRKFKEGDRVILNGEGHKGTVRTTGGKFIGITGRTRQIGVLWDNNTTELCYYNHDHLTLLHEKTIPFNIDTWRKGDFKKVVTRCGKPVTKLHDLDCGEFSFTLVGIIDNESEIRKWKKNGEHSLLGDCIGDLMLIIETTQP